MSPNFDLFVDRACAKVNFKDNLWYFRMAHGHIDI